MKSLLKTYECDEEEVQEICMQCLKELAVQEYDSLPFYFADITALVGRAMVDDSISERVQA